MVETLKIRQPTKKGYIEVIRGGIVDMNYPNSKTRRGRVQDMGKTSPTLTAASQPSVLDWTWDIKGEEYEIMIRKLTPRECWRLMGFSDEDYEKARFEKTNLYLVGGEEKRNAKLTAVKERPEQFGTETYALCITKDSTGPEATSTEWMRSVKQPENGKMPYVDIAIEMWAGQEPSECATNTIRCIEFMGIRYTVITDHEAQTTAIIARGKLGSTNTEKCMRITTEYGLSQNKLYTILTLFAQIIESKIFTSSTLAANIHGCIAISEDCKGNILMKFSNLEMEHIIERTSNTNLYKQAGNSIVKDVLMAIFSNMIPESARKVEAR